ncbi:hypothetical protein J5N97_023636 [Dioscorea zingiberensis]|uniref:Protein kinase domain-containing protein n=1 Tax=Dioscorea zingiberensis TaxID=325984 RepID=A0A9D5C621_9LILI|nr:hypothetical protein J5N97_023636 [Dioscorea zingiberensis]
MLRALGTSAKLLLFSRGIKGIGQRSGTVEQMDRHIIDKMDCLIEDLEEDLEEVSEDTETNSVSKAIQYSDNAIIKFTNSEITKILLCDRGIVGGPSGEIFEKGMIKAQFRNQKPMEVAVQMFDYTEVMLKEMKKLSQNSHPNIIKLIGYRDILTDPVRQPWCMRVYEDSCLVLELLPNGNLADYLFKRARAGEEKPLLTWANRILILLDVSRALKYLHSKGLAHGSVKAENILLSEQLRAKLSNFEKLAPDGLRRRGPTMTRDVYNFGVLMLVVILQKPAESKGRPSSGVPSRLKTNIFRRNFQEIKPSGKMNGMFHEPSLKVLLEMVSHCIDFEPGRRPTMAAVTKFLKKCQLLMFDL